MLPEVTDTHLKTAPPFYSMPKFARERSLSPTEDTATDPIIPTPPVATVSEVLTSQARVDPPSESITTAHATASEVHTSTSQATTNPPDNSVPEALCEMNPSTAPTEATVSNLISTIPPTPQWRLRLQLCQRVRLLLRPELILL